MTMIRDGWKLCVAQCTVNFIHNKCSSVKTDWQHFDEQTIKLPFQSRLIIYKLNSVDIKTSSFLPFCAREQLKKIMRTI